MSTYDNLKLYFQSEVINKRAELGITQEQMAENLDMSLRAYSDLEHGRSLCSLKTFSLYVKNCNADAYKLLSDLAKISKEN